jgi:phosphate starvation-inducible PhoH-like protein
VHLAGTSRQKYPQTEKIQETLLVKRKISPKNIQQSQYLDAIRNSILTIGTGPAGTGKSFIATYVAIEKLLKKEISKIILTRPVVEAGENLGFLPGTLEEKVSPYLRPVLDCIEAHIGITKMNELIKDGIIEFAPLAFMRGRTFSNCMVILDESQNTTVSQMKMFLTRLGENCTMVVDGDLAQSDLKHQTNGLQWIYKRFQNIDDQISTVEFTKKDIVRHPLIEKMLIAFEDETFEQVSISKLPSGKEKEITADDMGGMKSADFSNLQKELGLLQEEKPTRFPNLFDMFKKS